MLELGCAAILCDFGRDGFTGWHKVAGDWIFETETQAGRVETTATAHVRLGKPIELDIDGKLRLQCPNSPCAAALMLAEAWRQAGRPYPLVTRMIGSSWKDGDEEDSEQSDG